MLLSFFINPSISFFNSDQKHVQNYKWSKMDLKLRDAMTKDILSKKFRDWYSSNLNETVTQDPKNIDNYLNFNITKIQNVSEFKFKCLATLTIDYKGKFGPPLSSKMSIDKLMAVKNMTKYLKGASQDFYSSADSFRGIINYNNFIKDKKKNNLYGLYAGDYFLQDGKIKQTIIEPKPYTSCKFVIFSKDIKEVKLII
jgi:hypothetical protein